MTQEDGIEIQIASDLDYENLLAEIHVDNNFIGLLTNEPEKGVCFEVPDGKGGFRSISIERFRLALDKAKKELLQE